ncbi:MAG: hypothetical protein LBJ64_10785, partial [Deltaproteobacteria bacterium]|nr:hypothetical protein [Deltaproteobacteria bacterium]
MAKNKNNKKEQPKIAHPHLQMAQLFKECQWDKFLSLFNRFKSDPLVSKWAGHVPYALHGKLTDLLFRQKSPKNLIETANKLSEAAAGSDMVHLRDCAKIAADCLKVGTPGFAAAKLEQQSKLPPAWKKIRNLQSEYGQLVFGQQDDLRMSKIARLDALYRKPDKKPEHYWEMYQTGTELSELARFAGEKQVFEAMAEAAGILNDFSRDEVDDWRQPDSQAILSRVQKIARQSRHPAVKSLFMQVLETGLRIFGQTWFDAVKINLLKKYPQLDSQAAEVHQKFLTAKKTAPKGKLKNKMSADLDVLLSASIFSPQERYLLACLKSMLVFKTNFGSDDLLADPADGYISFFKKESAFKLGFSNFVDSVSQIERCAEAIGPEQLVWPKCVISCLSKLASVTPDLFSPLSRWSKNFSSFSDDILASFLLSLGEDEAAVRDYLSANNRLISNRKSEAMCFVQRWLAKDNPVSRRIVSEIGYFFERLDGIEKCFHPDAYKELLQDIVVNAVVSVFFSRLETLNDYYDPLRNKRFFEIFFENPEYFRSKVGD